MSTRNALTTTRPTRSSRPSDRLAPTCALRRLRRNLSIEQVAEIIGAGPRAIRAAEQGRVATAVGVYIALLWAYDLLDPALELADPGKDETGLSYLAEKERQRASARNRTMLDNDF